MNLCLVHNDPSHTLLINPDGIPLYASNTTTEALKLTTIRRIERDRSSGRTEAIIGRLQYQGDDGLRLSLMHSEHNDLELVLNSNSDSAEAVDVADRNSWSFTGPDNKPYKWKIFIKYPVLFLNDNSQTPLARYRRAKLGIVSRSRKASLEILPAGINCIDMIVVTFVSFMVHRYPSSLSDSPSTST